MDGPSELFEQVFYSIAIVSKVPFDNPQSDLISALQDAKNVLGDGEIKVDSENDELELSNIGEPDQSKRFELTFMHGRALMFGVANGYSSVERDSLYTKVLNSVLDRVKVIPAALEFFDKKVRLEKKTIANPEFAFAELTSGSIFYKLVSGMKIYNFRPMVLFAIDDTASRICRLELTSNIPRREVDSGISEIPNTARITCSVGLTRNLDAIENMNQVLLEHISSARNFFLDAIIPNFLEPFLKVIEREEIRLDDAKL